MARSFARRFHLAGALLAATLTAACGRGDNQSADRNGADTTSADSSATGPLGRSVGDNKEQMDSTFAQGKARLDSLKDAGVRPANGLDSVASRVEATTANEPGRDTAGLVNAAPPSDRARTP